MLGPPAARYLLIVGESSLDGRGHNDSALSNNVDALVYLKIICHCGGLPDLSLNNRVDYLLLDFYLIWHRGASQSGNSLFKNVHGP